MYYRVFRWFPKSAFSRLMGLLASVRWPRWVLGPAIRLYVALFRIDMRGFVVPPEGFPTFNAFFTRAVAPGSRPVDPQPDAIVSPVDGTVIEAGTIEQGRLLQAKGHDYSLRALLADEPGWEAYDGGQYLTVYLSPRDYHRIHSPCAGTVERFTYVPGELWTVSPAGVRTVPGLFARNERLVSYLRTDAGEVAVVKVGATVVGRIRVVYHPVTSNRRGARSLSAALKTPYPLERGDELGRFELGSTVILLVPPGTAALHPLPSGEAVRMGQAVGRFTARNERPA